MTPINSHGVMQKNKLIYANVIKPLVRIMVLLFQNKTIQRIYIMLICDLTVLVGLFFINYGQFMSHPSSQTLSNLALLVIAYFIFGFFVMVIVLYDKIVVDWKSRDLIQQINSVIKSELNNSKLNPKNEGRVEK
jgi:hypothetical protein